MSDSLENITSASNLRNDMRKASKNVQHLDNERKDLVNPHFNTVSQENGVRLSENTRSNKTANSPSKHSMHLTCNNCKLVSLVGDDLRNNSPDADKNNSVDVSYNVITIRSRRSDLKTNLSSKNSIHSNESECSMDVHNNNYNAVSSTGNDFKQQTTNSHIDKDPNQYSMYMSNSCFDTGTVISRGNDLRDASSNSQITDVADGKNKYSLNVLYNNSTSESLTGETSMYNIISTDQNNYYRPLDMNMPNNSPSTVSSGRNYLREAPKENEVVVADNQNKDNTFSKVSSHVSDLQQTSKKSSEVGDSQNKCAINISFNTALTAKKSPDLRLPKRINCWDTKPPVARSNSEKLSSDRKVKSMIVGEGHTKQETRNVKAKKSITTNAHSLQKTSSPSETKQCVQIDENKSKTQTPTTMPLSWHALIDQTHNMQSKYCSAEHQGRVKQGTESTDKLVETNSISLKLSSTHPIIPIRKRKRAIDEDSLLVGSQWKSMFKSKPFHLHSQDEVNVAVHDKSQPPQTCWSTDQLEDYIRAFREIKANQVSKNIDNGEKETNVHEQQIFNLEPTNGKGTSGQSDLESTPNSPERPRIRHTKTKVFSKSCPAHKIVLSVGAQASQDVDYTTTTLAVKHCNEDEHTPDSTNTIHTAAQKNTISANNIHRGVELDYPQVREQKPSSINSICREVQQDYPQVREQKPSSINSICREVQQDYPQVREQKPSSINSIHREVQQDYPQVREQKPSSINSICREVQQDYPQVREQKPSSINSIHREVQQDYPQVREQKPSSINSIHRELQQNYDQVREQTTSSHDSDYKEGQVDYHLVRELNPFSISSTHKKVQANYDIVRELNPFSISSTGTHKKVQANYDIVREPIPNRIGSIRSERREDYRAVWKQKPNAINTTHQDVQVDYPPVQKQNPNCKSTIHRERRECYPAVWEQKSYFSNQDVQVDYPQVQKQNPNYQSPVHKERLAEDPAVWEQKPSCSSSIHRERQMNYPAEWEQKPNHIIRPSIHEEVQVDYPQIREPKPSSNNSTYTEVQVDNFTGSKVNANLNNNFQREIQVNHTVPRWTTTQESERYLNSCNYSDYKERMTFSSTLNSNNQQQCKHCRSVRDEFRGENLIPYNSDQKVDQNLQINKEQSHEEKQKHMISTTVESENACTQSDKNKDMQQRVTKASRDFQNFSSEHLANTVYYNLLSSKDFQTECHEPQTAWKTMEELSEHSSKNVDTQYIKSQHKSIDTNKPISVPEEHSRRDFQTELHKQLPQTQWTIPKISSEHSNTDVKFVTLKSIAEMDKMQIPTEETPSRDVQSEVYEVPEIKWERTEELSKHGKIDAEYNVRLKSISGLNQTHVEEKPSRDNWSEDCALPETKHVPRGANNCNVFLLESNAGTLQTHAEDLKQCFLVQKNEMTKLKSKLSNKYLESESKVLRQQYQSQTKQTPEYNATLRGSIMDKNELNKLPEVEAATNRLSNTAEPQEKRKHKTRVKREGGRESKEDAPVKPIQQYRIKWMTRKENELHEQAMASKLAEAELIVPGNKQRRPRPTSKKSKAAYNQSKCTMHTVLEPNESKTHLQIKGSTSENNWHNCTRAVKENVQETWCQNYTETRRENENNKIENTITQYQELKLENKSDSPNNTCMPTTISHADEDPSDGYKQVRKPSQETTKPTMKDASTYCNFKRTRKIVQQLKAEYGNFEALADRMKHITKKVLAQVDSKTVDTKGLDKKIKDLYDYCQKRHTMSLKDTEYDKERKPRSKVTTNAITTTEQNELRKLHHTLGEMDCVSVLSEDMELDALLHMGVLGRGCCGLPPSLIHMHGVVSNIADNQDLKVIKLQYGDTHYVIEGTTVPSHETKVEEGAPQTEGITAVTIASENLWQKIKELYDYSKALYAAKPFPSNTSVHSDDVDLVAQSTDRTDNLRLECKDISDDSLAHLEVESNYIPAKDENMVLGLECNDASTWNENVVLQCNDISEDVVLACNDLSEWNEKIVSECNSIAVENGLGELECNDISEISDSMGQESKYISAKSRNVGKQFNPISTGNESTFLDCYGRISNMSENVLQECNNISVKNENILAKSTDIYVRNDSLTLESDDWARNVFVSGPDGHHKQFNSQEGENAFTCEKQEITEQSMGENSCFLLDADKSTTAYQPHNLTTNNTMHYPYHQQQFSYSHPDATNTNQSQTNQENTSSYETKNLYVNAELINNSTLNLILKFSSTIGLNTDTGLSADVEVDGHGELIHSSTERLPISVALEHADLGKENAPMVTTIINVKNTPIMQNDKLEIISLDSESVNICLAMECKPNSEQDVQQDTLGKRTISKQFFLLKQSQLQGEDSTHECFHNSGEVLMNGPTRPESCGLYNQKVLDHNLEIGDVDKQTGAYTLNVFVIRQPGIDLYVRSSSESSLGSNSS